MAHDDGTTLSAEVETELDVMLSILRRRALASHEALDPLRVDLQVFRYSLENLQSSFAVVKENTACSTEDSDDSSSGPHQENHRSTRAEIAFVDASLALSKSLVSGLIYFRKNDLEKAASSAESARNQTVEKLQSSVASSSDSGSSNEEQPPASATGEDPPPHKPPPCQNAFLLDPATLFSMIKHGQCKVVRDLLKFGANVNATNTNGYGVVHEVALHRQWEMIEVLREYGADMNQVDHDGRTPLHIAIENRDDKMVKALVKGGAHMKAVTKSQKRTVLHEAARAGHQSIYATVFSRFVVSVTDWTPKDADGKTPYDLASAAGHTDLAKQIKRLIAQHRDSLVKPVNKKKRKFAESEGDKQDFGGQGKRREKATK